MTAWRLRLDKMVSNNIAVGELLFSLPPPKKILHYVQYDSESESPYTLQVFHSPSNSTAVLNLNHSLGFSSSRSFCTFLKKYQKRGSRVRHSLLPLFTNCISISCCNILQSVHTSPLAACRNAWGGKNSLRSNIMPPVSNHCSAAHCASQRCPFAFSDGLPLQ